MLTCIHCLGNDEYLEVYNQSNEMNMVSSANRLRPGNAGTNVPKLASWLGNSDSSLYKDTLA